MAKDIARKEKLSIYLAKRGIQSESALLRLENTKTAVELKIARGRATLHVKREEPAKLPEWSYFLSENQALPEDLFGKRSSVGAVVVVRIQERVFLLCFGTGYHLLKSENIERDFGLRVTLNSVDADKLRSLDKASFESNPLNSRTQSTRDADVYELHVDSEMDLLYALTGTSTVSCFGETVTGRDALTITREATLDDLPDLLEQALVRYEMQLPARFDWVDNIHKIKNDEIISILEMVLEDYLADPDLCASVWIGEPEIVDWEGHAGYSFEKNRRAPRHPVLKMSHLKDYLLEQKLQLTVSVLKALEVYANDGDYHPIRSWNVYRCLYAEITSGDQRYILRNGIWYSVDQDFANRIDQYLASVRVYQHDLPMYCHDSEAEYNADAAKNDHSIELMDKKTIPIGGPYDKVEFCDLIKEGTDLIHVKYYRSSATLSHLFAQGCVASEAFVRDEEFRQRVNARLPRNMRLTNPLQRPDPQTYRIVFAIATDKELPKELPFFSKVTLKNSLRTLRALDFQVEIARIAVQNDFLRIKKFKTVR